MTATETSYVRQYIENRLLELGASRQSKPRETILIRAGMYCGQRFQRDGFEAIWFVEENQIKFRGPDGSVVETQAASDVGPMDQKVAA